MKKITAAGLLAFLLFASHSVWSATMPPLARQYGCTDCHDLTRMMSAPPWMDVAQKYRNVTKYTYQNREYSLEDGLVMKVSHGGAGNWGSVPMPSNDPKGLRQAEMRELVRFILQLGK
jgi:cytochrome c551/c552